MAIAAFATANNNIEGKQWTMLNMSSQVTLLPDKENS
jgi:hypothetical protein